MPKYNVRVAVDYNFEFEADTIEEAEQEGWRYEEYPFNASVDLIRVEEIEDDSEYLSEEEED